MQGEPIGAKVPGLPLRRDVCGKGEMKIDWLVVTVAVLGSIAVYALLS